jgi:hypothetical protein
MDFYLILEMHKKMKGKNCGCYQEDMVTCLTSHSPPDKLNINQKFWEELIAYFP